MTRIYKIYEKAKQSQNNLSFSDLCLLVEKIGYVFKRQKGNHRIYKHNSILGLINIQNVRGKAKAYQVRQILDKIEQYNLLKGDD